MPTPVTIGPVEFSADEEKNMRQQAQRARETAAARLQGKAGSTMSAYARDQDGNKTLVERKPFETTPISRDEF